jgi:hypothetical protein
VADGGLLAPFAVSFARAFAFPHRAAAAFLASSFRCFAVRDAIRALPPTGPPFLPRAE